MTSEDRKTPTVSWSSSPEPARSQSSASDTLAPTTTSHGEEPVDPLENSSQNGNTVSATSGQKEGHGPSRSPPSNHRPRSNTIESTDAKRVTADRRNARDRLGSGYSGARLEASTSTSVDRVGQASLARNSTSARPSLLRTQSTPVLPTAAGSPRSEAKMPPPGANTGTLKRVSSTQDVSQQSRPTASRPSPFEPSQEPVQQPRPQIEITPEALEASQKLQVYIPTVIASDLMAIGEYVHELRSQYALYLAYQEETSKIMQRIQGRANNHMMAGRDLPQSLKNDLTIMSFRLQKCEQNLQIIRERARSSPEPEEPVLPSTQAQTSASATTEKHKGTLRKIKARKRIPSEAPSNTNLLAKRVVPLSPTVPNQPSPTWIGFRGPFERTERGALKKSVFSVDELRDFFTYHTRDGVPLKLWIQKAPQPAILGRQDARNLYCRFSLCAHHDQEGLISPFDIRVAFDESPQRNPSDQAANPEKTAGYVHLLCLEQRFHFPTLLRRINADVETYRNDKGVTANASPGLTCSPAISVAKKFLYASQLGRLDALCPDYPARPTAENFPVGFTGLDELTLAYKMQWAHKVSASLMHKQLSQTRTVGPPAEEYHPPKKQKRPSKKQQPRFASAPMTNKKMMETTRHESAQLSEEQDRLGFFKTDPSQARPTSSASIMMNRPLSALRMEEQEELLRELEESIGGPSPVNRSSNLTSSTDSSHSGEGYTRGRNLPAHSSRPVTGPTFGARGNVQGGYFDLDRRYPGQAVSRNLSQPLPRTNPSAHFLGKGKASARADGWSEEDADFDLDDDFPDTPTPQLVSLSNAHSRAELQAQYLNQPPITLPSDSIDKTDLPRHLPLSAKLAQTKQAMSARKQASRDSETPKPPPPTTTPSDPPKVHPVRYSDMHDPAKCTAVTAIREQPDNNSNNDNTALTNDGRRIDEIFGHGVDEPSGEVRYLVRLQVSSGEDVGLAEAVRPRAALEGWMAKRMLREYRVRNGLEGMETDFPDVDERFRELKGAEGREQGGVVEEGAERVKSEGGADGEGFVLDVAPTTGSE
ncbi:MAG: hypothetical protein Q9165_005578 [Trypethelium subeluteriae]